MTSRLHSFLIFVLWTCTAPGATAQAPDELPAPRSVAPPAPPVIVAPYAHHDLPRPPRLDSREIWQYYGVNRYGYFRPRVILAPQGAYYQFNGAPYPWQSSRTTNFMPYALD